MNDLESAFVHLHAHSYFSLQEGLISPEDLVKTAKLNGMQSIALVDHRCLSGVVAFEQVCRHEDIRPIYGLEIELSWQGQQGIIVLLAANQEGWSNLCRLSSQVMLVDDTVGEVSIDLGILAGNSAGLIALTGGQRSLLDTFIHRSQEEHALQWLAQLHDIFSDKLFIELQQHSPDQEIHLRRLVKMTAASRIPYVATHDIYYLNEEDTELQKTLASIRLSCKVKDLRQDQAAPSNAYFSSQVEMKQRFAWLPEAIENTRIIAALCNCRLPIGDTHFPEVPLPAGKTVTEVLREKAYLGARQRYGRIDEHISTRLEYELGIIAKRGYEPIFLIVEELLEFARQNGVPISSRGSAASSLVAYCLRITNPDPLALDLYFERFLNPARSSPPDIDTDLCSRRRDLVIQHVFDKYGSERVAMVATINCFRPRSALGEVAKAFGLATSEVRQLVESLPYRQAFGEHLQSDQELFAALESANPRFQRVFEHARRLLDQPRHLSMHPGGILVAPGKITDLVPVMRSGGKGVTITQFDLEGVARFGLVKIDLLGIRGLSVLGDVAEAIFSWRQSEFSNAMQVLHSIPLEDEETARAVRAGQTIGCFQIESPGMRATLREIEGDSPADIMSALALYRPGPLRGGLRDAFVRRFKKLEPVEHIHPILEPLLAESYGVILYQEQVLRIAHELGGLSLADADLLRRAMSHFDPGEHMKTLQQRFLAGFQQRGVSLEKAEKVWEMMAAFAGYGFPKAHAASYALVAWQSAWCKAHFPAEFMNAVLANGGGYYSQRVYLSEARRLGLRTEPPHINHSGYQFRVAYPQGEACLYMGLDQVYGLTRQTQERIIANRPYHSLDDFLSKVDPRKAELENLIRCGALSGFGSIPQMINRLATGSWRKNQPNLFVWQAEDGQDWSMQEKAQAQEQILGVSVNVHPLDLVAAKTRAAGAVASTELINRLGESLVVAGSRMTSRRVRTAKGDLMLFLTLEDLEGMLSVVFFPQVYRQYRAALHGNGPFLIRGVVEWDQELAEVWLRAEKVRNLNPPTAA